MPAAVLLVVYAPVMVLFTVLAIRLDGMGIPSWARWACSRRWPPDCSSRTCGWASPAPGPGGQPLARSGRRGAPRRGPAGFGALRLDYSASNPRPDFLSYVYDAGTGRAAFEATDRDSWSRPLLVNAQRAEVELSPFATFSGWRAPAPALDLAGPRLVQRARTTEGTATKCACA